MSDLGILTDILELRKAFLIDTPTRTLPNVIRMAREHREALARKMEELHADDPILASAREHGVKIPDPPTYDPDDLATIYGLQVVNDETTATMVVEHWEQEDVDAYLDKEHGP